MTLATARLLVGRTIVGVYIAPGIERDNDRVHYQPTIVLDNGARITFSVTESDQGCFYGITPRYSPKTKEGR